MTLLHNDEYIKITYCTCAGHYPFRHPSSCLMRRNSEAKIVYDNITKNCENCEYNQALEDVSKIIKGE